MAIDEQLEAVAEDLDVERRHDPERHGDVVRAAFRRELVQEPERALAVREREELRRMFRGRNGNAPDRQPRGFIDVLAAHGFVHVPRE